VAPATPAAGPPGSLSRRQAAALFAVPVLAAVAFLAAVGGPAHYFANLDRTGELTAGLTYLIWVILGAKYLALALAAARWRAGLPATRGQLVLLIASLALVAGVGARLLVMVAILQVALVWTLLRRRGGLPVRRLLATAALLGVVFVGLGELRRWQGLETGRSFPAYFVDQGLPNLPGTYVNQYADAVRLAALARDVVPDRAGYEYGLELLRIALQPIPGSIRPEVPRARALRDRFTSGEGNGNALPLPVVGYIQGGLVGAVLLCALLGVAAGMIDRRIGHALPLDRLLALVAAAVGLTVILRGTLVNAVAFTLMDVIGFFVAVRVIGRLSSRRSDG
jgi:hypothetical protein